MTETVEWEPDVPGRGAWSLQGGLVNNSGGVVGYYQTANKGPQPGAAFLTGDTSDSAYCVHRAIKRIQNILEKRLDLPNPFIITGVWNESTQEIMTDYQESAGLFPANGIFGQRTSQVFFKPQMVAAGRKYNVPWAFLYGMTARESSFDPAAVGSNGYDHGLVQINLSPSAHGLTITREQALSPSWCYRYAAKTVKDVYSRWKGNTTADPWDIAIANHNSPVLAKKWAETGEPPFVEGRVFQIEEYVIDIRSRAEAA